MAVEEARSATASHILRDIGHNGSWELEWWSIYTANTLCLDEYKHGRVIFIGDSAHIVPIFGVRGLNNGLADAYNVGWKLSYVLNGDADASLLDTYSPERRGATLDVFANASKSARFMTSPTRGSSLVRDAVLSLALRHEFVRPFINPRQMEAYLLSMANPISCDAATRNLLKVRVRVVCPVRLKDGSYFLDEIGPGFTAYCSRMSQKQRHAIHGLDGLDPRFTALSVADECDARLRRSSRRFLPVRARSAYRGTLVAQRTKRDRPCHEVRFGKGFAMTSMPLRSWKLSTTISLRPLTKPEAIKRRYC